jgi:hypothetical protein
MSDAPSPSSLQSQGSSSISRTYGNSGGKSNPILNIVNDYYTKQQAAYMQQRRRIQTHENESSATSATAAQTLASVPIRHQPTSTQQQQHPAFASSVLVSPPTASNTSYPSLVDTSAISAQNMSTASARSTPPVERLLKWSEKREEALQRIREEEEKKKYAESTFRPNLAKARSASSSSASSAGDAYYTHEQLHRNSHATSATVDATAKHAEVSVAQRLLMQGQLSDLRKDFLRDSRNREIETQHTFQPVIHQHHSSSAFRDPTAILQTTEAWDHKRGAIVKEEPPMDPECTFRPTINPPPKRSNSATAALSERSNNIIGGSSMHDQRSSTGVDRDDMTSFQGTVLSAATSQSERMGPQHYLHEGAVSASSVSVLEDALVDELQQIRAACHSRGLHHGPRHSLSSFLASMCETVTLAPVPTTFQSSAFLELRASRQRVELKRENGQQQPQQPPLQQKQVASLKPTRTEHPAKANQVAVKVTKRQQEKDNDVLRELSPIHRFVVGNDDGVDEVSIGALGSSSGSSRSRSGSSLRFEVENDDDSEFARTGSSTGMVILSEATPRHITTVSPAGLVPFDGFLLRQEQAYRAKQRRLEQLIRQTAPPLKPNICEHSRQLASASTKVSTHKTNGDVGTSATLDTSNRANHHRNKTLAVRSHELTFRPVITHVAANCPPRGFDDMHLDFHRRQEKLEQSAQKKDSETMNECTFLPQTNRQRNTKVESTLNPRNFNLYQEQLARQRQQQEERRAIQERNAAMDEFSNCTFKPRVNRTPSYISRMTGSVSALREAAAER